MLRRQGFEARGGDAVVSLPDFQLVRPRTVAEAVDALGYYAPEVQLIAGGTDLIPSMKQRLFSPKVLVDIRGIDDLKHIRSLPGGGVEIGALTPLAAIEDSEYLRRNYPVLREAAGTVASPILRNMGTVGGNICQETRCLWYNQSLGWRKSCGFCLKKDGDLCHVAPGGTKCWAVFSGDTPPALLCLEAEIELASTRGTRRMALSDFYNNDGIDRAKLKSDELLTRVFLPETSAGYKGAYQKLRVRGSIDYPLAGVAVVMRSANGKRGAVQDARVAITAVNPAPLLIKNAAHALIGRVVDEHVATVVGELAADMAKPLTTSTLTPEYRREMIKVFAKRAVLDAARS
jgi:4-hydroxybenzoyl-CoA reductase subunit beta